MASFLRPDADAADGNWTDGAGGTVLYTQIDETSASEADYIRSGDDPADDLCRVTLSNPNSDVDPDKAVTVRYRYRSAGPDDVSLTVNLKEGATVRATWTHDPAPGTITAAAQTLSPGEKSAITDWDNLSLEFSANLESGVTLGTAVNFNLASNGGGGGDRTLSSVSIGAAAADRDVYVIADFWNNSGDPFVDILIDGVSATLVASASLSDKGSYIYRRTITTGTSVDVVLDLGTTIYSQTFATVVPVYGRTTEVTGQNTAGGASSVSTTVNMPDGAIALVIGGHGAAGHDHTLVGATTIHDQVGFNAHGGYIGVEAGVTGNASYTLSLTDDSPTVSVENTIAGVGIT